MHVNYKYLLRISLTFKTLISIKRVIKTGSTRKLSNFNFQWTKILYQNNLNNIAFFFFYSFQWLYM